MPHPRSRHLLEIFSRVSAHSPLVGVLGHRQVGKTTFLNTVSQRYVTLDDSAALIRARMHSADFIREHAGGGGTAVDECQMAPELFPALKEWVRTHPRPGQFFMSGSVRFTSRQAIRESLTGRIMNVELLPFGMAELAGLPLPHTLHQLAHATHLKSLDARPLTSTEFRARTKTIDQYLDAGGLPGICFVRDARGRAARIEEQLYTILDRDLRTVQPIQIPYRQILDFLGALAASEGDPVNHTAMRERTGIAPASQKKLLYALEAVFIIRAHRVQGETARWTYLFEDQAEWEWLVRSTGGGSEDHASRAWTGAVYRNLRVQFNYRLGEHAAFFGYRTRSGVHVPWVVQAGTSPLGIVPILGNEPSHKEVMGAHSFLRKFAQGRVIFVSKSADRCQRLDDRLGIVPAVFALFE